MRRFVRMSNTSILQGQLETNTHRAFVNAQIGAPEARTGGIAPGKNSRTHREARTGLQHIAAGTPARALARRHAERLGVNRRSPGRFVQH
jgi:hypothetical protein